MADVFEAAATNSSDNFLEKYVGEGKKYKTVEDLAKAYDNANNVIPTLKEDLQTQREFIAAKLEELANQRNTHIPPNDQTVEPRATNPAPAAPPNGGVEELDARIKQILENDRTERTYQDNAQKTESVLIERLGSREAAIQAVQQKAQELGVEPGYLKQTAFTSPKAFFNLMGIDPEIKPTSSSTPGSASDVNPRALAENSTAVKAGTYGYYDNLRKSDPKRYWSPAMQKQMMLDAQAKGDEFFN